MAVEFGTSWIETLELLLGGRAFISLRETVDLQIFGSMSGARLVLSRGELPFVKISPRRLAIPSRELIKYLKKRERPTQYYPKHSMELQ